MEEESQEKILERLKPDDYLKIKFPIYYFFDDGSSSESDDSADDTGKNQKEILYEKCSIRYLSKTILKLTKTERKSINYNTDITVNELTVYNPRRPWFNEKLFDILVEFCKSENDTVFFIPDYIINNISGSRLSERINNCKEIIQYRGNWIKTDKNYDLIGEISIDYLTDKEQIEQTKKYIKIIKLLQKIQNDKEINIEAKKAFEKKFNLIYDNEKVLVLSYDGNYDTFFNALKDSNIFKDNNNIIPNESDIFNEILKILKESGVNFIIYTQEVYITLKSLNTSIKKLEISNNEMKEEIKNLEIINLKKEIKKIEEQIAQLSEDHKKMFAKLELNE